MKPNTNHQYYQKYSSAQNQSDQNSPLLQKGQTLLFQTPDERHRIFKKILAHFNVKVHSIETRSFMKIFGLQIKSISNDQKSQSVNSHGTANNPANTSQAANSNRSTKYQNTSLHQQGGGKSSQSSFKDISLNQIYQFYQKQANYTQQPQPQQFPDVKVNIRNIAYNQILPSANSSGLQGNKTLPAPPRPAALESAFVHAKRSSARPSLVCGLAEGGRHAEATRPVLGPFLFGSRAGQLSACCCLAGASARGLSEQFFTFNFAWAGIRAV